MKPLSLRATGLLYYSMLAGLLAGYGAFYDMTSAPTRADPRVATPVDRAPQDRNDRMARRSLEQEPSQFSSSTRRPS